MVLFRTEATSKGCLLIVHQPDFSGFLALNLIDDVRKKRFGVRAVRRSGSFSQKQSLESTRIEHVAKIQAVENAQGLFFGFNLF